MDKPNGVYPDSGILFGNKKERDTDTCYNIANRVLTEGSQTQKATCCIIPFI